MLKHPAVEGWTEAAARDARKTPESNDCSDGSGSKTDDPVHVTS
jgi:hypothetical protein